MEVVEKEQLGIGGTLPDKGARDLGVNLQPPAVKQVVASGRGTSLFQRLVPQLRPELNSDPSRCRCSCRPPPVPAHIVVLTSSEAQLPGSRVDVGVQGRMPDSRGSSRPGQACPRLGTLGWDSPWAGTGNTGLGSHWAVCRHGREREEHVHQADAHHPRGGLLREIGRAHV